MGCEMQPGVMRAQKREIQISRVTKILYLVYKNLVFIWNWKSFLQLFSKHILKSYKFYEESFLGNTRTRRIFYLIIFIFIIYLGSKVASIIS
jgi:hypothetical protein